MNDMLIAFFFLRSNPILVFEVVCVKIAMFDIGYFYFFCIFANMIFVSLVVWQG